ncbi:hypothetical protein QBC47DRAFT_175899 [Echria macrotheca]|uniref:Uncharacterized protein n=1 Tax=Echria macrotheca TaxID=438768 RepID=A0AAJ0BHX5_9PEZI|nr:hypothetical protein QBC47DRAFT_175899 [Echria macrotheca]
MNVLDHEYLRAVSGAQLSFYKGRPRCVLCPVKIFFPWPSWTLLSISLPTTSAAEGEMSSRASACFSTLCFTGLSLAVVLGIVNSVLFFLDDDAMAVPGQAAAQGFMLFAINMTIGYLIAHGRGAYLSDTLFIDWERGSGNRVQHRHFAWTAATCFWAAYAWLGSLVLVGVEFRSQIWIDNLLYRTMNLVACCVGATCAGAMLAVICFAERPFRFPIAEVEEEDEDEKDGDGVDGMGMPMPMGPPMGPPGPPMGPPGFPGARPPGPPPGPPMYPQQQVCGGGGCGGGDITDTESRPGHSRTCSETSSSATTLATSTPFLPLLLVHIHLLLVHLLLRPRSLRRRGLFLGRFLGGDLTCTYPEMCWTDINGLGLFLSFSF